MKVYESMLKTFVKPEGATVFEGLHVRVWRTEFEARDSYDNKDVETAIQEWVYRKKWVRKNEVCPMGELAEYVASLPRVAAVEILDGRSQGILIYNDWP